jgi:thymidylate synthase
MSHIVSYPDFHAAYLTELRRVCEQAEFVNAPRGNRSREILSVAYRIENPRERIVRRVGRKYNLFFNFAEVLWYLSGSSELAMIACYGPLIARYSADGHRLNGSAYGPRIFQYGGACINQWDSVVRVLREDPDSKRAFIQVFSPAELLQPGNIDVACTLGLQYFIREGALHAAGFMRANDAFRGSVSDVFAFTFLQELMANELGLKLGTYTHFVSTYHVYDADLPRVRATLDDPRELEGAKSFPEMPAGNNWASIRRVLELERNLRQGTLRLKTSDLAKLDLPPYWRNVVCLFALHAEFRHDERIDAEKVALLPACFGSAVRNLWPQAVS